ncbi:MAG: LysE family translocator [Candidatus Cryptobacteroides sp.]
MLTDIIKGFIIGICASAPLGPIGILVVQKTLSSGRKAGFATGMGACIVDTLFAVVALFALSFAQEMIDSHKEVILIAGGLIVAILGWSMARSNPLKRLKEKSSRLVSFKDFGQALIMGLSNPGAIIVIFGLFAFFGIGSSPDYDVWNMVAIILAVFAGATTWWFSITGVLNHFRKRFRLRTILWTNRVTGIIVIIIGIALFCEGIYKLIFHYLSV